MLGNDFSNERPLTEAQHIRQDERMADFMERFNRRLDWDEFPPAAGETPRRQAMSAANYLHPEYREGAYFQLGRLRAKLEEAKIRARRDQNRAERAERLLEALGGTLGVDLDVLERIGQAEASYFKEVRGELLKALEAWAEDQKIPVCLHCGSPRVDWIETEAAWRCQDCGTLQDSTGEGRAKNEFCSEQPTKGVNR